MAGYTRNDVTDQISNGNTVDAIPLDGEFEAIQSAFASVGGHAHNGSVGEGAPILVVGPTQDVVVTANSITPKTDNIVDLGSTTLEFKDLWIDGVANIDSLVADTADINAGTIDATVIGATTPAAATVTTLAATSATVGGVAVTTNTATQTLTGKTINLTSNTLVATSAQIAAAVTDETGTGALVFAGSPTLTGVPTAPTAVADTNTTQVATTAHVFAERSNTATLTNKTLTSPTINGGTISGITDLAIVDGGTGSSTAAGALTNFGLTATAAEINKLAGTPAGLTATELGFVDGVTSSIQTQIDGKQPLDSDLTAVAGLATNGLVTRTGTGTATTRSVVSGTAITVTNGDGVAGNPTIAFEGTLGTVGVTSTTDNDGTFTTGTYTPTPVGGNFKAITANGAFSIAAPSVSGDYTLIVQITNGATAGVITLTGFTKVSGDAFTTINADDFFLFITKCNGFTSAVVQALQ